MKKAKVAHLTSVHHPFDTRIFDKELQTLARAGYDVVSVVPYERNEVLDEDCIRVVPEPKNRWERMTRTVWQVYRTALAENVQVCHFHDPELIPVSLLLKLRGKRVIYDVHEDLPRQILTKPWISPWLRRILARAAEFVENVGARSFDGIVAATPLIAKRFPQGKTVTVQNFPILSEMTPLDHLPYRERAPVVAYAGHITVMQGIREIVCAMALLPESPGAYLILAGIFESPTLEDEVRQMSGWERVSFLGWLRRAEVIQLLQRARIGIVVDHPVPNYLEGYSTKLFDYMASGIPVVGSDFPLWREIIEGAGCGLLVDPLNPKAIAEAVQWLLVHPKEAEIMGRRGQEAVRTRYNWNNEAEKLLSFYRKVVQ